MDRKKVLEKIYKPSEDVVARDVQGEFIIIPIASGIADSEEEIFTLNETAKAIWHNLDGKKTLGMLIDRLTKEFEAVAEEMEKDVLGFTEELLSRKMLIEVKKG